MATTILRINPFDTFFFRDGKPFTMGDDSWADGIFPPSPSVIYGALRTAWISEKLDGFVDKNIEESKNLSIKGIFVEFNNNSIALPVPRDLVHEKGNKNNKSILQLQLNKAFCKNAPSMIAMPLQHKFVEEFASNSLIKYQPYERYLKGVASVQVEEDYLIEESKIGIGRQFDTRTSEEGSLYRVDMKRFKNEETSIIVECEGLDFVSNSFFRIGGEGKVASYNAVADGHTDIDAPMSLNNNRFKICLSTPSIFDKGWLPDWINETSFEGEYKALKLKLIATVLGKPVNVGGFDVKLKKPKTMYKAIPAGSVYWFELLSGTMQEAREAFHYQSISEQKANEGFGITYIGA